MTLTPPNKTLQRTAASRSRFNPCVLSPPSLSFCRSRMEDETNSLRVSQRSVVVLGLLDRLSP